MDSEVSSFWVVLPGADGGVIEGEIEQETADGYVVAYRDGAGATRRVAYTKRGLAEAERAAGEAQAAQGQPAETQGAETQPAETQGEQPAETQPAETQLAETQQTETQGEQTAQGGQQESQQGGAQQQSALGKIPVRADGEPDFDNAQSAADVVDGLTEYMNGDKEQAKSVINGTLEDTKEDLRDAQKALEDLVSGKKKKGAKRISDPIERAKMLKAAQEAVDKARQRVDHWQAAADEVKRREEAETPTETPTEPPTETPTEPPAETTAETTAEQTQGQPAEQTGQTGQTQETQAGTAETPANEGGAAGTPAGETQAQGTPAQTETAEEAAARKKKKEELSEIWSGNVGARFSTPEGEIRITAVDKEDGIVKYELNGKMGTASVGAAERNLEKGEWKPMDGEGVAEESQASEGKAKTDKQGNPVDERGKLITEKVKGIDELTDGDFTSATRSVELPKIPENVDKAIGADGKPVIIKKNIFEKNRKEHPDITPRQSREILRKALYSPNLVGQTQPIKRPHYWVAIQTADKNSVVVIEVNRAKDNTEIVGWRFADAKKLEQLKRQAEREGGQFLIQTSGDAAAALSALPSSSSSGDKGTTNAGNAQGNGENKKGNGELPAKKLAKLDEGKLIKSLVGKVLAASGGRRLVVKSVDGDWIVLGKPDMEGGLRMGAELLTRALREGTYTPVDEELARKVRTAILEDEARTQVIDFLEKQRTRGKEFMTPYGIASVGDIGNNDEVNIHTGFGVFRYDIKEAYDKINNGEWKPAPEPVGKGPFGNIYDQFKGKVKEAVAFLTEKRGGEAVGALHHKDVGDIGLVWGEEGTGHSNGYGLAKIAKHHPEVLDDLQGVLDGMRVVSSSDNRIVLESGTHKAVVSRKLGGKETPNWLLTAYEKKGGNGRGNSGGSSNIVPEPGNGEQNGTAPLQGPSSAGEVTTNAGNAQGNGAGNAQPKTGQEQGLSDVPEMGEDRPSDARARGWRRVNGKKVERQGFVARVLGKAVEVKFSNDRKQKGHVALVEASSLQPSHTRDGRNPLHFLDEAQPKERVDVASGVAMRRIAESINPEEITGSVTAYTGAPSVNARGETIQGNNRAAALKEMWRNHPGQAERYRQYLREHAEEFGLTPEQVDAMENPVLVNMLEVDDADAIRLGQFTAADTETGGVERIRAKNAQQAMGGKIRTFAAMLMESEADEELSFSEALDRNAPEVLRWMRDSGFISPTQYGSAFDSRGNVTAEAKNDLRNVLYECVFEGANPRLAERFNRMPAKAQKAVLATMWRDGASPESERMIHEVQRAIDLYDRISQTDSFKKARTEKHVRNAVWEWMKQTTFDEETGETYLPVDKFSNFAVELATRFRLNSQKELTSLFDRIYDLVQGREQADMFDPEAGTLTLKEAIKKTLGIDYDGEERGNTLAGDNTAGEGGEHGVPGDAGGGEPGAQGAGAADGGGGAPGNAEVGGGASASQGASGGSAGGGGQTQGSAQGSAQGQGVAAAGNAEKIDDWGEELEGARKFALRDFAETMDKVSVRNLVAMPLGKVFPRRDFARQVARGKLSAEDATFLEALQALAYGTRKPQASARGGERKVAEWAEDVNGILSVMKAYCEAGTPEERRKVMETALSDADIIKAEDAYRDRLRAWNSGGITIGSKTSDENVAKIGSMHSPHPVRVAMDILRRLGYPDESAGKAVFPTIKSNHTGTEYEVRLNGGLMGRRATYGEALDYAVKLAKTARGDGDVTYDRDDFGVRGEGEMGRRKTGEYTVTVAANGGYLNRKNGIWGHKDFATREEAEKYAADFMAEAKEKKYRGQPRT